MNTTKLFEGYEAQVFFRTRQQGAFKAGGWCYRLIFNGQCVKAGCNLHSRDAAEQQAANATYEHIEQRGAR